MTTSKTIAGLIGPTLVAAAASMVRRPITAILPIAMTA
jgi:hypothetical protein